MMRSALLALFLCQVGMAIGQPQTDEQLAAHYFQNGDYEKAALYYEKLYDQKRTTYFFDQYYKTLVGLSEFERAEKLLKTHMKREGDDPRYYVDLGDLYVKMGEEGKAQQHFEKALKELPADASKIRAVANSFIQYDQTKYALQTYEKGQKLLRNENGFHYEIANLYGLQGDIPAMVREYMDLLSQNEGYIQSVQNSLARYIDFEVKDQRSDALRTELLRRIQRDPERMIYPEMLIWMYIQQKDLYAAMVQSKAIDKRFSEGGTRLMDLAQIALGNSNYSVAVKCFEYVRDLNNDSPHYAKARIGLVKALDQKTLTEGIPSKADLSELEHAYVTTLEQLGNHSGTLELMRGLANLRAYYLNDADGAISVLEKAMVAGGLSDVDRAELKLQLGDVHVLKDAIWDASLLFSQVDLDFKHEVIGHEARFRNARVSYYAGDFLWAQAQLDVLKASTSKLIANDAMELSLLITDNLGLDSNSVPLEAFAKSELLVFQHRYSEATTKLDSLDRAFPMHGIGDNVLFARYKIAYAQGDYDSSATYLLKLIDLYGQDILADNALYALALLYEDKVKDEAKAKEYYEKLLFDHPGSIYVVEARERYRRLRGDIPIDKPKKENFEQLTP